MKRSLAKGLVAGAFGFATAHIAARETFPLTQDPDSNVVSVKLPENTSFSKFCDNLITDYIANMSAYGKEMVSKIQKAKRMGYKAKQHLFRSLGLPMRSYCVRFGLTLQKKVQQANPLFASFEYYNPSTAGCLVVRDEFFELSKENNLPKPHKQNVLKFLKTAKPYSFYRVLVNSASSNSGLHYATVVAKLDENKQQMYHEDGTPQFMVIAGNDEHFCSAESYFVGTRANGYIEESSYIVEKKLSQAFNDGIILQPTIDAYNLQHNTIAPFDLQPGSTLNPGATSFQPAKPSIFETNDVARNILRHKQEFRKKHMQNCSPVEYASQSILQALSKSKERS